MCLLLLFPFGGEGHPTMHALLYVLLNCVVSVLCFIFVFLCFCMIDHEA